MSGDQFELTQDYIEQMEKARQTETPDDTASIKRATDKAVEALKEK